MLKFPIDNTEPLIKDLQCQFLRKLTALCQSLRGNELNYDVKPFHLSISALFHYSDFEKNRSKVGFRKLPPTSITLHSDNNMHTHRVVRISCNSLQTSRQEFYKHYKNLGISPKSPG